MDLGIAGRTALVLGAGGGLGSAIALALAAEGAQLVLADISEESLVKTGKAVAEFGIESMALAWDLGDFDVIDDNVRQIEQKLGEVNILINNTGGPPPGLIAGQGRDVWDTWFRVMVQSVIGITDRVLPSMVSAGWGRVITSTSSGVVSPIPNLGLSNALRSTLVGWSKTLAAEVGAKGVTSNIVLPGRIATGRILYLDEQKATRERRPVEEVRAASLASIPAGRYGNPEEYGDTVAFLASTKASYINGSIIRVDGGYISSI